MFFKKKAPINQTDRRMMLENCSSETPYAEAFRTLRTNLFFSVMEKELKSVVVTSAVEAEGKTLVSVNLAHTIAQTERRVLLVDMDLRRPHLTRLFGHQGRSGVTELLATTFGRRPTGGSLSDITVADLIQLTRLQKRSCCLTLENNQNQIDVLFEKGQMVDVHWKNRPQDKRLATTLVRSGLLSEEAACMALNQRRKSGQRLGNILYTMGLVSREDLSKVLGVHIMEGARTMSAMENGRFFFSEPPPASLQALKGQVDLDRLYGEFNFPTPPGRYFHRIIKGVIQDTGIPHLKVLPAGAIPPNPAELAGSSRTGFLLDYLKTQFDVVIIDTPPVMPATDALLIAPHTDGALMVIRANHADRGVIAKSVEQFEAASLPILGTVLNRVDTHTGYYRHFKDYYGSNEAG